MTRSWRVTAAFIIAKYVNRASSLFTGAHAFHIRLRHRNSYSVGIFCIIFDIILQASPFIYDRFAREFTATVSQSSSTSCSTSFLARLVTISSYYFMVSLLLFAFLSKRNGAPCNSADYPGSIFFFSHLNLGACAGFALTNCDWLGRTIAFYQVFFQQGRVALSK